MDSNDEIIYNLNAILSNSKMYYCSKPSNKNEYFILETVNVQLLPPNIVFDTAQRGEIEVEPERSPYVIPSAVEEKVVVN